MLYDEGLYKKISNDVVIEIVNISYATYRDSITFKKILTEDIVDRKFKKVIIDISKCEFIDSTFLGAIIFARRELDKLGGKLRIIQPDNGFNTLLEKTPAFELLKTYDTLELAMENFNHD